MAFRVLHADDHPTNRMVVEMILKSAGAEVIAVENGAEALELFKREAFDLVLMDVQMPVMDGLTAIAAMRAHEREHRLYPTAMMVLSTNSQPGDFTASAKAGADRHLTKPVKASELLSLAWSAAHVSGLRSAN